MCHTSQALQLTSVGTKERCLSSAGMEAADDQKEILEDRWVKAQHISPGRKKNMGKLTQGSKRFR